MRMHVCGGGVLKGMNEHDPHLNAVRHLRPWCPQCDAGKSQREVKMIFGGIFRGHIFATLRLVSQGTVSNSTAIAVHFNSLSNIRVSSITIQAALGIPNQGAHFMSLCSVAAGRRCGVTCLAFRF